MSIRARLAAAALGLSAICGLNTAPVQAADHADSPLVAGDQGCDIADVFFFLDPQDNTKVVLAVTIRGFIAAGENVNFGYFDSNVRHRFQIENTGDTKPDMNIDVTFSRRVSTTVAQTATITLQDGTKVTAPATNPSLAATAPPFVVTTKNGVDIFAGLVDDPFFFDIPGFARFIGSVRAGTPDPTQLSRGRDSFAGYNIMAIALRMPLERLKGSGDELGLAFVAQRRTQERNGKGEITKTGKWRTIDREGNPALNAVFIPQNKKNLFNAATPKDDADGKFLNDFLAVAELLGVDDTSVGIIAQIAIQRGDYLRLDTTVPNTGNGSGTNNAAAFPNGRRYGDDTIDTLLTVANNRQDFGDSVNSNDVAFTNTFPYFGLPQQPRAKGVKDDNTRN